MAMLRMRARTPLQILKTICAKRARGKCDWDIKLSNFTALPFLCSRAENMPRA
jgi:hypothetical protein